MTPDRVRELLESVRRGDVAVDAALESLSRLPFVDTENARVDTHRALRHGLPEVVFGLGKSPAQIVEVVTVLRDAGQDVLVSRVEAEAAREIARELPGGDYDATARLVWFGPSEVPTLGVGTIAVVSAGTADLPVAAEAVAVARRFGNKVLRGFRRNDRLPVESLFVPLDGRVLPATRLSDHASFWDRGWPAVMVTDTAFFRNPNYHTPLDRPETLDFAFMAELVTSLEFAVDEVCAAA